MKDIEEKIIDVLQEHYGEDVTTETWCEINQMFGMISYSILRTVQDKEREKK